MTAPAAGMVAFRLVPRTPPAEAPSGVILPLLGLAPFLQGLASRAGHYDRLLLALGPDFAVLFAMDGAPLPWSAEARGYLRREGALFLPVDQDLNVPEPWRAEVVRRLMVARMMEPPALLRPSGSTTKILSLKGARRLADLDFVALKALAA